MLPKDARPGQVLPSWVWHCAVSAPRVGCGRVVGQVSVALHRLWPPQPCSLRAKLCARQLSSSQLKEEGGRPSWWHGVVKVQSDATALMMPAHSAAWSTLLRQAWSNATDMASNCAPSLWTDCANDAVSGLYFLYLFWIKLSCSENSGSVSFPNAGCWWWEGERTAPGTRERGLGEGRGTQIAIAPPRMRISSRCRRFRHLPAPGSGRADGGGRRGARGCGAAGGGRCALRRLRAAERHRLTRLRGPARPGLPAPPAPPGAVGREGLDEWLQGSEGGF